MISLVRSTLLWALRFGGIIFCALFFVILLILALEQLGLPPPESQLWIERETFLLPFIGIAMGIGAFVGFAYELLRR